MSQLKGIRWGWLKTMYAITILFGCGYGLGMILAPEQMKSISGSVCDPIPYGIVGSVFLAFGLLAILGLRAPLKFAPVLLLQLAYKVLWCAAVVLPLLVEGRFPAGHTTTVVLFALTIIGDFIAIPFGYVFAKETDA